MALVPTLLERGKVATGTVISTSSLTPDSTKAVSLAITSVVGTELTAPVITGTNGWDATWNEEVHIYDPFFHVSLYSCLPVSDVAGIITFTQQNVVLSCLWDVIEWGGADTADPVGDVDTDGGTGTAVSGLSLTGMAADSGTYIFTGIRDEDDTISNEGGSWVDLGTTLGETINNASAMGAWLDGQDTSPTSSWPTSVNYIAVGCEIKAAASAGGGDAGREMPRGVGRGIGRGIMMEGFSEKIKGLWTRRPGIITVPALVGV